MNNHTLTPPESQHPSVTNWKDMPTETQDDLCQFSIYVAKRAGWTVTFEDDYILIESADGKRGQQFYNAHPLPGGIEQAWLMGYYHHAIPAYATDVNAALELVEFTKASFRLDSNAPGWWRAWFSPMGTMKNADTPALAICLAWLDWQDANGGQS